VLLVDGQNGLKVCEDVWVEFKFWVSANGLMKLQVLWRGYDYAGWLLRTIDNWLNLAHFQHLLQVLRSVVGHAKRAALQGAIFDQLLELLPEKDALAVLWNVGVVDEPIHQHLNHEEGP
jgi:hypothetical protein